MPVCSRCSRRFPRARGARFSRSANRPGPSWFWSGPMSDTLLAELAAESGIHADYWDVAGKQHHTRPDVARALLEAMGIPAATPGDMNESLSRLRTSRIGVPPVMVVRAPVRELAVPARGAF